MPTFETYACILLAALVAAVLCVSVAVFSSRNAHGAGVVKMTFADFCLFGFLLSSAILLGTFAAKCAAMFFAKESPEAVFLPTILAQILLIAVACIFKRAASSKFEFNFGFNYSSAKLSLIFFVFAFFTMLFIGLTINMIGETFFGERPDPQDVIGIFLGIDSFATRIMALISIVVLAPISEELVFRGLIYRMVKGLGLYGARWRNITLGLVVSSLLFSMIHFNLFALLPLFVIGAILVGAYEKSGNIAVPIVVHSIFNITNIAMLLLNESVLQS